MHKTILTAGFAMFSMFFGSGNLVFPLLLGTQTGHHATFGFFGFFLTAVCVPFIGLVSMIRCQGDRAQFFGLLGAPLGFVLTCLILSVIGPFAVIPRCISVAFGGLHMVWPNLSFPVFSAAFCVLIGILIWRPNRVVDVIGVVLTPFKLGGIALLILAGILSAPDTGNTALSPMESLHTGADMGYQTLDLLAAFFFSATIVEYLRREIPKGKGAPGGLSLMRMSVYACLIGGVILTVVYACFVFLGAAYAPHLTASQPEALLAAIGAVTLGKHALVIVSIVLAVSCLATAVILADLFAVFFKEDVMHKTLGISFSYKVSILITLCIAFAVAQVGFQTICAVLGSMLAVAYPAFIALAIRHLIPISLPTRYDIAIFCAVTAISGVITSVS